MKAMVYWSQNQHTTKKYLGSNPRKAGDSDDLFLYMAVGLPRRFTPRNDRLLF